MPLIFSSPELHGCLKEQADTLYWLTNIWLFYYSYNTFWSLHSHSSKIILYLP